MAGAPQGVSKLKVVDGGDTVVFSKDQDKCGHVVIQWVEAQSVNQKTYKQVKRAETYRVFDAIWTRDGNLKSDQSGKVVLFIADVLVDPEYHVEDAEAAKFVAPLLEGSTHVDDGKAKLFEPLGKGGLMRAKMGKEFLYGQDVAQDPTRRFIVYHPQSWRPKQCHFYSGITFAIGKAALKTGLDAAVRAGLALASSGIHAQADINNMGITQYAVGYVIDASKNRFGHCLRRFGTDEFVHDSFTVEADTIVEQQVVTAIQKSTESIEIQSGSGDLVTMDSVIKAGSPYLNLSKNSEKKEPGRRASIVMEPQENHPRHGSTTHTTTIPTVSTNTDTHTSATPATNPDTHTSTTPATNSDVDPSKHPADKDDQKKDPNDKTTKKIDG